MVATPRATIANQLKKGTVQLNVLQREEMKSNISSNAYSRYNKNMLRNNVGMSQQSLTGCREKFLHLFEFISVNVRKHLDVEKHFFRNSSFTCIFNYNF